MKKKNTIIKDNVMNINQYQSKKLLKLYNKGCKITKTDINNDSFLDALLVLHEMPVLFNMILINNTPFIVKDYVIRKDICLLIAR